MKYIWLDKNNAFFPVALKPIYIDAGWDLSDAIPIDDTIADEFMDTPPDGKIRGVGSDGMPAWVDAPEPADLDTTGWEV